MTLSELYFANNGWNVNTKLTIYDVRFNLIKAGINACLADVFYGDLKVCQFNGNLVVVETLKEENHNE